MTTMEQMVEAATLVMLNLHRARNGWPPTTLDQMSDEHRAEWMDDATTALRAALPILGDELGSAVWLASKNGLTHDQISIRLRSRLSEIMEGK